MSQDGRHDRSTNTSRDELRLDENGNMVNAQGGEMGPYHDLQQYVSSRQQQRYAMYAWQFRESLSIGPTRQRGRASEPQYPSHLSPRSSPCTPAGHESRASLPVANPTNGQQAGTHDQPAIRSSQQSHRPSLATARTNNSYSVAPPAHSETAEGPLANDWLPQDASLLNFDSTFPTDDDLSWYQVATSTSGQPGIYEQSPLRSREPLTPSIRLTSPDVAGAQPQDTNFSTSPMVSLPPYPYSNYPEHNSGHLNLEQEYSMTGQAENMQTPVSPVSAHSPRDTSMAEQQLSRKRSHSEMSQSDTLANAIQQQSQAQTQTQTQTQAQVHSRSASVASQLGASPNGANEDFNPRGSRAFKRGDPPQNEQNKYICTFAEECAGQTFDRKCEWSKHMDKHDRPYRCQHQSCAKLQGFTYSGGLLRHEREVHGKHGGPRAALMCPVADCKRHSGKGFTRKENLNEHLRRVHPGTDAASQSSQPVLLKRDATDVTMGGEDGDTPASMGGISETIDQQQDHYTASPAIANKRKRSLPGEFQVDFTPDHEPELKRLRQLVQEQEQRIREDAERLKLQDANANHYENRVHELERQNADQADRISKMESELAEANIRSQLVSANANGAV